MHWLRVLDAICMINLIIRLQSVYRDVLHVKSFLAFFLTAFKVIYLMRVR